jgi:hypothetical protein
VTDFYTAAGEARIQAGVTHYQALQDARTQELLLDARSLVQDRLVDAVDGMGKLVSDAITTAYQRGVTDGFAQGVAAQADAALAERARVTRQ